MVRGSIIEGSGGSRFGNFRFVPSLVEIGQADAGISNKTIEFDFKDGDILELQDIAEATIKFNDFVIISCVKC